MIFIVKKASDQAFEEEREIYSIAALVELADGLEQATRPDVAVHRARHPGAHARTVIRAACSDIRRHRPSHGQVPRSVRWSRRGSEVS